MASGLWSADVLSQTRRGLSQRELQETLSREPDCGNRNVGRTRGVGEATRAWEVSGKRASNTETRFLPTICYGYSRMAPEEVWTHYPHRSGNCRSMVGAGLELGSSTRQVDQCSYNISLSQIS